MFIFIQRDTSSITLVGLPLSFGNEVQRISVYMEENVETELVIKMTYSQAMFFSNCSKEIGVESNIPDSVEWFREEGGIHIRGRARLVRRGSF